MNFAGTIASALNYVKRSVASPSTLLSFSSPLPYTDGSLGGEGLKGEEEETEGSLFDLPLSKLDLPFLRPVCALGHTSIALGEGRERAGRMREESWGTVDALSRTASLRRPVYRRALAPLPLSSSQAAPGPSSLSLKLHGIHPPDLTPGLRARIVQAVRERAAGAGQGAGGVHVAMEVRAGCVVLAVSAYVNEPAPPHNADFTGDSLPPTRVPVASFSLPDLLQHLPERLRCKITSAVLLDGALPPDDSFPPRALPGDPNGREPGVATRKDGDPRGGMTAIAGSSPGESTPGAGGDGRAEHHGTASNGSSSAHGTDHALGGSDGLHGGKAGSGAYGLPPLAPFLLSQQGAVQYSEGHGRARVRVRVAAKDPRWGLGGLREEGAPRVLVWQENKESYIDSAECPPSTLSARLVSPSIVEISLSCPPCVSHPTDPLPATLSLALAHPDKPTPASNLLAITLLPSPLLSELSPLSAQESEDLIADLTALLSLAHSATLLPSTLSPDLSHSYCTLSQTAADIARYAGNSGMEHWARVMRDLEHKLLAPTGGGGTRESYHAHGPGGTYYGEPGSAGVGHVAGSSIGSVLGRVFGGRRGVQGAGREGRVVGAYGAALSPLTLRFKAAAWERRFSSLVARPLGSRALAFLAFDILSNLLGSGMLAPLRAALPLFAPLLLSCAALILCGMRLRNCSLVLVGYSAAWLTFWHLQVDPAHSLLVSRLPPGLPSSLQLALVAGVYFLVHITCLRLPFHVALPKYLYELTTLAYWSVSKPRAPSLLALPAALAHLPLALPLLLWLYRRERAERLALLLEDKRAKAS